MTPADELRTAAAKLRAHASAVPSEPWTQDGIGDYGFTVAMGQFGLDGDGFVLDTRADNEQGRQLADYIAAMSPAVVNALAGWLDETARNAEPFGPINHHAVNVARAINGGQR